MVLRNQHVYASARPLSSPFLYFESLAASESEDGSISFSLSSREELLSRKYLCTTQEKIIFRRFGEIADPKGVRKKLIENLRKKASSRLWFMVFDETVKKLIHRQHKYLALFSARIVKNVLKAGLQELNEFKIYKTCYYSE